MIDAARARLLVVLALATALYAVRLGQPPWAGTPPHYTFDEKYTAFTAHRLLAGDANVFTPAARRYTYFAGDNADLSSSARAEWSHPPGAPLAIVPFIFLFGYSAAAARVAALLAALVTLVATASLAGRRAAWLACALLAADGAFFVLARLAMPHMFLVAGATTGAACLRLALVRRRRRLAYAAAAGLAFGYAIAVRWTAAPIAAALLIGAAASALGRRRRFLAPVAVAAAAAFVAYLATFLPFFAAGHSWADLVTLHRRMLWFHTHLPGGFAQSLPWYRWPWTLRPMVLGWREQAGRVAALWCSGGRVLGWALVPLLGRAAWRARRGGALDLLVATAISATWLPWAALARFGFAYHLLPALPLVAVAVARRLATPRWRRLRRPVLLAAIAEFAISFPVHAALPMARATYDVYRAAFGVGP